MIFICHKRGQRRDSDFPLAIRRRAVAVDWPRRTTRFADSRETNGGCLMILGYPVGDLVLLVGISLLICITVCSPAMEAVLFTPAFLFVFPLHRGRVPGTRGERGDRSLAVRRVLRVHEQRLGVLVSRVDRFQCGCTHSQNYDPDRRSRPDRVVLRPVEQSARPVRRPPRRPRRRALLLTRARGRTRVHTLWRHPRAQERQKQCGVLLFDTSSRNWHHGLFVLGRILVLGGGAAH